jgi:uncharacterized short protein YbdD (DUF466 family)
MSTDEISATVADAGPRAGPLARPLSREMLRQGRAGGAALDRALRFVALVRQLFGMPDYERYRLHHSRCHAGAPLLSEKEFVLAELERKYAGGGGRCC